MHFFFSEKDPSSILLSCLSLLLVQVSEIFQSIKKKKEFLIIYIKYMRGQQTRPLYNIL